MCIVTPFVFPNDADSFPVKHAYEALNFYNRWLKDYVQLLEEDPTLESAAEAGLEKVWNQAGDLLRRRLAAAEDLASSYNEASSTAFIAWMRRDSGTLFSKNFETILKLNSENAVREEMIYLASGSSHLVTRSGHSDMDKDLYHVLQVRLADLERCGSGSLSAEELDAALRRSDRMRKYHWSQAACPRSDATSSVPTEVTVEQRRQEAQNFFK